ncbi:outer dynein arm-docking complex subunit 4-like [Ruditapes philippinarum]|uniref:outer dynein arm-docking complex subunit 4-like n=1 Tax=Ruditapes philippinarum TaxID=129788 RepID=UPI00295ABB02|nr:outer dynein arm-docking complex subunit 4-like [Ruditapes philippinarum]
MLSDEQYTRKEILMCDLNRKEGDENFNKQKYTKAIKAYGEALRHVPDDIRSLVGRSKCHSKLRKLRKAMDDIEVALHIHSMDKDAMLQKADILDQLGNHEMALVYYHRGLKRYPKSEEFKAGLARAEKRSAKKGRRLKMTSAGDITYFTASHKPPPPKQFEWKSKPKDIVKKSMLPSANFRSRLVHPLTNVHRKPEVLLTESRATTLNGLLAGSLESLAFEDKLIDETTEKDKLGKMYDDKEYLEFLLGHETYKNKKTPLGEGSVATVAETGLQFLQERTQFWDSLGPLPPPHPSRKSNSQLRSNRSRMSTYTSTESLQSVGTYNTSSTVHSYGSKYSKASNKTYRSRYAYGRKKEKPQPPKPEKVKFDFASYRRDEELREMTMIAEEIDQKKDSEEERRRNRDEAVKRGEETTAFIEKEIVQIDKYYSKGQLDLCRKRADAAIDVLGRFTEEEIPTKYILLSTLYSCLGNCDMQTKNLTSALENHGHDLMIGEQCNNTEIQSRALGNIGRVNVLMGKYNRALDIYNRKAPLCTSPKETSWLFHEIGNCFLMMKIYEYAHESGLKSLRSALEANDQRLQLQSNVLVAVAEVNLMKYKDAYQHFEDALERAKLLNDKRAQDAMTRALVDLNKKMVTQLKKKQTSKNMRKSPVHYDIPTATPVSRPTPSLSAISAKTNVTVEG